MFTKLVNDVEEGKSRHRLFILLYNDNTRQSYFSTNCVHFFLHPLLGERDSESILKINQIIEEDKTKNLISKSLYLHVKGRLNKLLQEVLGLKYLPGIKYYICLQKPWLRQRLKIWRSYQNKMRWLENGRATFLFFNHFLFSPKRYF